MLVRLFLQSGQIMTGIGVMVSEGQTFRNLTASRFQTFEHPRRTANTGKGQKWCIGQRIHHLLINLCCDMMHRQTAPDARR